jgi:hypothetical protein
MLHFLFISAFLIKYQIYQLNISVNGLEQFLILLMMTHPVYKINSGVLAKIRKSKAAHYEDKE